MYLVSGKEVFYFLLVQVESQIADECGEGRLSWQGKIFSGRSTVRCGDDLGSEQGERSE